ncbi:MAG: glutamate 5-kinase [Gammaproteobacteria bacterium]|jgi:glutamate 5-kinase|nr:glutamate 5-kinase [Gammaproteobacteria bacterium]MDA0825369.1 glutamate 5-kinase [Pseudomonadota bacterium]MDA8912386.1 glutamate 5-kinase [Pseudomonadales bacterium]MCH9819229.1 glutamate 5-kinase [Gammaproteobacteria bacterium]MCO4830774.1 glutamate 5-kinase [Gammaproteobacteria bacterium]
MSEQLDQNEVWVLKVGSSLVTAEGAGLNLSLFARWARDIADLRQHGIRVVLVSSGAVAEGMVRLGLTERPNSISMLQAAAAVGQMGLIQQYQTCFDVHQMKTAQILLTHSDLRARDRYLNARNTIVNLLALGVVPIVNENDTVVTDEIRFGDNDTLAAMVANLIDAKRLVILTDQLGLFDRDPRTHSSATLIPEIEASNVAIDEVAGSGGKWGRGGMVSKVQAARIAARSGCETIICSGNEAGNLGRILQGQGVGTRIKADRPVLGARKHWLATLPISGVVTLDAGAVSVIQHHGRSLLAVGITAISGEFSQGSLLSCCDSEGLEVCRGLTNYSSEELKRIQGKTTQAIEVELGYLVDEEVIHRDDLLMV